LIARRLLMMARYFCYRILPGADVSYPRIAAGRDMSERMGVFILNRSSHEGKSADEKRG
jgi:hypothetical protein